METASVAVGDVPGSERSLWAGVIPLGEPSGTAAGTLLALLLQALQSDGAQAGIRCEDAVLIELDLFHALKVGWIEGEVNGET